MGERLFVFYITTDLRALLHLESDRSCLMPDRFTFPTRWLAFCLLGLNTWLYTSLAQADEPSFHEGVGVRLELISEYEKVAPGQTFTVGLKLNHKDGYHTYWRSSGIVGMPTTKEWSLSPGVTAGPILWPAPKEVDMVGITAWGYQDEVCLLTEVTIDPGFTGDGILLQLKSTWMCCSQECNPGFATLSLRLPVGDEAVPHQNNVAQFHESRRSLPQPMPKDWAASFQSLAREKGDTTRITIDLGEDAEEVRVEQLRLFSTDQLIHSDLPQTVTREGSTVIFELPWNSFGPKEPESFQGLLVHPPGWSGLTSAAVHVSIPAH